MFDKIKGILSSKKFKIIVIAIFMIAVIIVKVIDVNKGDDDDKSPQSSANTSENTSEKEPPGIHIGVGHIVMLIVFSAAYGIDRVIVYRNNLKDEQKYDNYKEK